MAARILAIGDELLSGARVDTNSPWLARELLSERGIHVDRILVCSDSRGAIESSVGELASGADLLILSGGLGPTEDDRTRHALASLFGVSLHLDPAGQVLLSERLAQRGLVWTESFSRQVMVPEGLHPLANPLGQALGLTGLWKGCRFFSLPGVPGEMKAMFSSQVLPQLDGKGEVRQFCLTALGEPEATLGERLQDLMSHEEPKVGITVEKGVVIVRITATGPGASNRGATMARTVQERLGSALAGQGRQTLAHVVAQALLARTITLATAESCTGGLLASELVALPGISEIFRGGFVVYANEAKEEWLRIDKELLLGHGAVSKEVAQALSLQAARLGRCRMGVGITGIAGPAGAVEGKPVGTVHLAVTLDERTRHVMRRFLGDREAVREAAVLEALKGMWAMVVGKNWGEEADVSLT